MNVLNQLPHRLFTRHCQTLRLYSQTAARAVPHLSRAISQPTSLTHPHLITEHEVTPGISRSEFIQRRNDLIQNLPHRSVSIFPSNPPAYMTEDVPYLYHPNTDLMYICGIAEQGALLLAERTDEDRARFILFVQGRDESKELWDGPQCDTTDEIKAYFGVDQVRHIAQLPNYLSSAVDNAATFHYDPAVNHSISAAIAKMKPSQQERLISKWDRANSPKSFLLHQRLIKSPAELSLLRNSARIISQSLNDAMASLSTSKQTPHVEESHIDAVISMACKARGATRPSFPNVVASGPNGVILHYMNNNRRAMEGDFVMVDAGCEMHGYCSDVSRSWPVSGKFSPAQRDIYQLVLAVQKKCISLAVEGATLNNKPVSLDDMHQIVVRELVYGLLHLGFMSGHTVESAITSGEYRKYFPHATGHYLGMDVHDTHHLSKDIPFQKGMVITVEPGLYCPIGDPSVPQAFQGLGMRIEDDVAIGGVNEAPEVLSSAAVKELSDVESLVGSRKVDSYVGLFGA